MAKKSAGEDSGGSTELAAVGPGRPRKLTDPDRLQTLMEVKVTEQLSWTRLADWYKEEYGEELDPQTIRRSILADAPIWFVPGMVSKKVKQAIDQVWEGVDFMKIIMFLVNSRFTEWCLLYEKMIRAGVDTAEEGMEDAVVFTQSEQLRMDELWNGIISFFLRGMDMMKSLQSGGVAGAEMGLMFWARGSGVSLPDGPSPEGQEGMSDIEALISKVADQTHAMVEATQTRHREESRGMYRVIEADEEGALQEDG